MLTEKEILNQLMNDLLFPPLKLRIIQSEADISRQYQVDAIVQVSWNKLKANFIVEIKPLSTPMVMQNAVNQLKSMPYSKNYLPMIVMPYLDESQLQQLERMKISGIDLCGNGVVIAPKKFSVYRSGRKNRFPSSAPIKNIYKKNSSMVGRVFLSKPEYETVQKIRDDVNQLNLMVNQFGNKPMSLSTVSKALKTLENDLIIERKNTIRLLQPEKLLEKLKDNYVSKTTGNKLRLKVNIDKKAIPQIIGGLSKENRIPIVATGLSSVPQYAVMQRSDILSVYCPQIGKLEGKIPGSQSDRFPNLEIIETQDETVFFDARKQQRFCWASPVQVYLELMAGDKRDQETAEQVALYILNNLNKGRR